MDNCICIDFDNTVHSYVNGFSNKNFDPPVEGAIEALNQLSQKYKTIYILTAREELAPVELWMKYQFDQAAIQYPNNIEYTNEKPIADIYVDDRGCKFEGDWTKTINDISMYKIWTNEHRLTTIKESLIKESTNIKLARDLSVGDVLVFTNCKVVVAPSAGIKTPSGKIDLVVEYPNGNRVTKTWNKNTKINIKSETTT